MRTHRFAIFTVLVMLVQPSEAALINFKKIFNSFKNKPDRSTLQQKSKQPGQEVVTFKLRKAKTADLVEPLENYLQGLGGTGFITVLQTHNALVVTDFPETLDRLKIIIPDLDQAYEQPNPDARKMIVTQNLMKSIRLRAIATGAIRPVRTGGDTPFGAPRNFPTGLPGLPGLLTPGPRVGPLVKELDEMGGAEAWRRLEESYSIQAFQVVGWVKDGTGYTVVLNNQGNRFLFRAGRIRQGYNGKGKALDGITGTIHGMQLTLANTQGKVSLKMVKGIDQ